MKITQLIAITVVLAGYGSVVLGGTEIVTNADGTDSILTSASGETNTTYSTIVSKSGKKSTSFVNNVSSNNDIMIMLVE